MLQIKIVLLVVAQCGMILVEVEIEVLQKSLVEKGKNVMDEVLAALGKAYSESTALCEQKNKQIGNLKWQQRFQIHFGCL